MTIKQIQESLNRIEKDSTLQNFIAQANARYILYNTGENQSNFPPYTIKDNKLNLLAFQYLSLGCRLMEKEQLDVGIPPLEKGASILEYCHGSPTVESNLKGYFGLISALAYYICFQYSKSFILISKIENDTIIAKLVSLFLKRNYTQLIDEVQTMITNETYSDELLAEAEANAQSNRKVYEITIAKSLNNFVQYFYTGNGELLISTRSYLSSLKEITEIQNEPDIWWVTRLLILIIDGFKEASLWSSLSKYFNTSDGFPFKYINSLIYKKSGGIYELFQTQRHSLPKVLNNENNGCIISLPTSSGKTRIAEIAILDCLNNDSDSRVLYIAPFRSLAYEVENSLEEVFQNIGISVSHLYGGSLFSKLDEKIIEESQVIVATPEKAKAMLRSNQEILEDIKLVVVDEGHLFGGNKRYIVNEMFYEELRYYISRNSGRFLLLSAVLPNAEDLAQWLANSTNHIFEEDWKPSDERLGILEWKGRSVDLNWISTDNERDSFNPRFIVSEEQPLKKRQRNIRYFPGDKNQAVASTAHKLRQFGPVLIFVGLKASVFVMAREYEKCIKNESPFTYKNKSDWRAFELACIESYGESSEWLKYARQGILCHNANLLSDVRIPLERLMSREKPHVIIATSTLGQGVNLGVSSVIFATLFQGENRITKRDFWNIAGRAGRAFVDHEGKILVALDKVGKNSDRLKYERDLISSYFDKNKIDKALSGCLELIKALKSIASDNGIAFENLIELIANNNIAEIQGNTETINNSLDWIDDGILALHDKLSNEEGNYDWIDDYFRNSLAYIQAENQNGISGEEVIEFVKARTQGIITRIGNDSAKFKSIISSGIPLNSDLQIEDKMEDLISIISDYQEGKISTENKISLLKQIEKEINDINALSESTNESKDIDDIREKWLNAVSLSEFSGLENATEIITKYYAYGLPWILNGISKKLRNKELNVHAETLEELSILVELGLPDLKSVKIYQSGIRSRSSSVELSKFFDDELWERSIKSYKTELINRSEYFKVFVSDVTSSWLDLLNRFSQNEVTNLKAIPDFSLEDVHKKTTRLIATKINDIQYLASVDYQVMEDVSSSVIDFSAVSNIKGVFFEYFESEHTWKMVNQNPNVKLE